MLLCDPDHLPDLFRRSVISTKSTFDLAISKGSQGMRLILLIIIIILLVGALPSWPYSTGWGYYPAGGLGTILVILLILALLGII
jgi:hypothetical protein